MLRVGSSLSSAVLGSKPYCDSEGGFMLCRHCSEHGSGLWFTANSNLWTHLSASHRVDLLYHSALSQASRTLLRGAQKGLVLPFSPCSIQSSQTLRALCSCCWGFYPSCQFLKVGDHALPIPPTAGSLPAVAACMKVVGVPSPLEWPHYFLDFSPFGFLCIISNPRGFLKARIGSSPGLFMLFRGH